MIFTVVLSHLRLIFTKMKKTVITFCFLMLPLFGFSQVLGGGTAINQYLTDTKGEPLSVENYPDIVGSPYLSDWQEGTIILKTGQQHANIPIRYNIYDDHVEYRQKNEAFFFKKGTIREFSFKKKEGDSEKTQIFRCGFENIGKNTANTYYEVLYDGKYKLLCDHVVSIAETKAYSSASVEKKFQTETFLYIATPTGLPVRIKKNKKSLLEAINNPKLENWLTTQKNKCRNEAEIAEALKFLESE